MTEWEPLINLLELLNGNPRLKVFVQILSLGVLLAGLFRYIARPVWHFHWKLIDVIDQARIAIPNMMAIANEFKPNGGNSLRDIINRIDMRQCLTDERVLAILKTHSIASFEADHNGMYRWVNRMWCEVTGMMPEDALGHGWLSTVHPNDQERVSRHWNACIKQHREFILDYRIVTCCEDKLTLYVKTVAHVLRHQNSKVIGYLGTTTIKG